MFQEIYLKIMNFLFPEVVNGRKFKRGAFLETDERNFQLGWFWDKCGYTPKKTRHIIPTLSVKHQYNNTCCQESGTVQKEVDEQTELSEQSLTLFAKKMGYISGDGYSSLIKTQKAIQKYGIAEKRFQTGNKKNWNDYSDFKYLTRDVADNAEKHKEKSYYEVNTRSLRLKALDQGKVIHTAMKWYSGFNMNGGFKFPWIIKNFIGIYLGGHAFVIKGYDTETNVYIAQNSYGKNWGNGGDFYINMDFFDSLKMLCLVSVDMPVDLSTFLRDMEGKFIKADGLPGIYKIEEGLARAYSDKLTFYLDGGRFGKKRNYFVVSKEEMDEIRKGEAIKVEETKSYPIVFDYWEEIKQLSEPQNMEKVSHLIVNS